MIKSVFNKETGILDSTFYDDVDKDQIVGYIDSTRLNKSYPRRLKILTDSTRANMLLTKNDLMEVVVANLRSLEQYDYIFDAIVTENPKETAFSLLYKELSATNKYRFEVFNTRRAALEWLSFQKA